MRPGPDGALHAAGVAELGVQATSETAFTAR